MTERTRFEVGDRVRATAYAYRNGIFTEDRSGDRRRKGGRHPVRGVVDAVRPSGWAVKVRPEGRKTASWYSPNFWEPQ